MVNSRVYNFGRKNYGLAKEVERTLYVLLHFQSTMVGTQCPSCGTNTRKPSSTTNQAKSSECSTPSSTNSAKQRNRGSLICIPNIFEKILMPLMIGSIRKFIIITPYRTIITARKRSLGQGNIFTPVCHSVHGGCA